MEKDERVHATPRNTAQELESFQCLSTYMIYHNSLQVERKRVSRSM